MRASLAADLAAHGLAVEVHGRPKHLYSIWKKMRRKHLGFAKVLDVIALRVIATRRRRVLCRARPRPRALSRDRRRARRLHRAAEGERLPVAAHRRRGRRRRRGRDPDPHRRDARARRVRRVGALGLQGSRRRPCRGQRRRLVRGEGRAGAARRPAPAAGVGARPRRATARRRRARRRRRAPPPRRRASRFDDRIYVFTPQAAVVELTARGDADRLRLRGPHRSRPSLPRRQGRRRDRAAEHARCRAARWSR